MKKVVIIQEHLPHYRRRFFEELRKRLAGTDVHLEVIFGNHGDPRFVVDPPAWAKPVDLVKLGPLVWHRAYGLVRDADLVIVPQEVKYLLSHVLQIKSWLGRGKFAFWGHGRNFQAVNPDSFPERLKRFLTLRVDWWFAYNDLSARLVSGLGFPSDRITSVGNSVDTDLLIETRRSVTEAELNALRNRLGIHSSNVCIFTGGLHHHKRIEFLLEAAKLVRQRVPDLELLMIGDGPERDRVREASAKHPWIHDLGKMGDAEKVPFWMLGHLLLMPGLVGLVVVDSFALGVPTVTTNYPYHSPEIDYLQSGRNGMIVNDWQSVDRYAEAVADLLIHPESLERIREGALASAALYSIERMVDGMEAGILGTWKAESFPSKSGVE